MTLVVGQATRLLSTGRDVSGEWLTENPGVAVVTSDGVVSPTQAGTARLIHRGDTGTDTIDVTVRDPVDSVHLEADLLSVRVGRSAKLSLRAFDEGSVVPSSTDLAATWTSTEPTVATVDENGVVTATGVGCAAVVVNVDGKVDTETVSVLPAAGSGSGALPSGSGGVLAAGALPSCGPRLALRWTSAIPSSIQVGQAAQLSAFSPSGSEALSTPSSPVSYSTSNASVAEVSASGVVRGTSPGDVVVVATADGQSISASLSIIDMPQAPVARVSVSLARSEIANGDSTQATALAIGDDGQALTGVAVNWSVSITGGSVASVDGTGKIRSKAPGVAQIIANVNGVSGVAQLVVDAAQAVPIGTQTPTNPTGAAAVLALMGPTINASQTPASLAWYEANFKKYSDIQWSAFGPRWDAGNSNAGYDRAAINYVWWARTGDTTYLNRAHAIAVAYRNNYLIPAVFMTSPHWSQLEGLYLDWIVTGDDASRDAVLRVANVFATFDPYLDDMSKDWLENRVQTRVLLSYWMAEKIQGVGSPWTSRLDNAIKRVVAVQAADGHWGFPNTCGGSWNFMTGMLTDLLSRMYDQRGDNGGNNPAILSALTNAANYLWNTQWRPADQSFNYASLDCPGGGGPTSAPDLNGMILPVYGWLGKKTGDTSWFTKGDAILNGMTAAYIDEYKQLSESYTSSYRYLGYRYGL